MENKEHRCWTGKTDEEMEADNPELARQIKERREKIIKELEERDSRNTL